MESSSTGTSSSIAVESDGSTAGDGGGATAERPARGVSGGRVPRRLVEGVGIAWVGLALAIVVVPIVVATSRALLSGWLPLGDHGILLVRARDVGTSHHPLLGSWTSASVEAGQHINNPGPLYFDVIALPIKLLGPWVGLATGVMAVNLAAVVFAVIVAGRLAGRVAMLTVAAAIATLEWSIGSDLLFDVWQPNALLLPAVAFVVACWGLATGRLWFLPVAVGIGSLLVQTHLSYVYLVTITIAGAAVLALVHLRTSKSEGGRSTWTWPLGVTLAVVVVAWIQPVIEQFTASGRGNLARLVDVSQQDTERLGLSLGVRLLAEVLAVPPFWARPSYDTAITEWPLDGNDAVPVVSLPMALLAGGLLVILLASALWFNRTQRRPAVTAMVAMALIVLSGALVSLTLMPFGIGNLLTPHQMRWLWPLGTFIFASLIVTVAHHLVVQPSRRGGVLVSGLVAVTGTAAALAALPSHTSTSGPVADQDALPVAKELVAGIELLEDRGPVLFDTSTLLFAEPYSGLVFAELQDRDIPFYFEDEGWVRQLGESRRYRDNAELRIWLRSGGTIIPPEDLTPGVEQVVSVTELPDVEDRRAVALYAAPVDQRPED
jgi:hypothetical protein